MTDPDRAAQQLGRDFVFALHATLRALRLYPLENQAVQNALAELELVSGAILTKEGSISLHYIGDYCFVNDLRLRIDVGSFATFGAVSRLLGAHGVGHLEVGKASRATSGPDSSPASTVNPPRRIPWHGSWSGWRGRA